MIDNKPFAMFFNASPRKGWNTYKMLEAAKAGAEEAGATTELVNLYDTKFPGCKSCFACKLKNAKTNGVCAIHDDLRFAPCPTRVGSGDSRGTCPCAAGHCDTTSTFPHTGADDGFTI